MFTYELIYTYTRKCTNTHIYSNTDTYLCIYFCIFVCLRFMTIKFCRLFNDKSSFILINSSLSNNLVYHEYTV